MYFIKRLIVESYADTFNMQQAIKHNIYLT